VTQFGGDIQAPNEDRLVRQPREPILDPELPIIDTHHHFWDRPSEVTGIAERNGPAALRWPAAGLAKSITGCVKCPTLLNEDGHLFLCDRTTW
jgi:hypothetical protein